MTGHASEPRLAVVILTWNGREDTLECLDALRGQIGGDDAVIVCDNGSQDGTEAAIRSRHPWVDLIQNGANLGFAGGNNSGLRSALDRGFEWILVLNNDTSVPPGALGALLAHASSRPAVGAFQPLTVRADDPGRIDSAGQLVLRRTGCVDALMGCPTGDAPSAPTPIFGATASAALLRASTLRESGPFDEELFTILEDVDLMFRLRMTGAEVELVPHVRVAHKRGISGAASTREAERRRNFWIDRNVVALALRYWPARHLVAAFPLLAVRSARSLLRARQVPGQGCLGLWRRSCSARRVNRRAMRRVGLDHWFSGASVSGRVAERTRAGTLGQEALR